MALASRGQEEPPMTAATATMTVAMRHWRADRETSPERTKVWSEPKPRKVPVVYYLTRNGQLEHPHFMEVALPPCEALRLRDVLDRLNSLRGKGIADGYSWSSKRSYKNGFVWHDLTEDDLIHPAHGHEYVLKGSELLYPIVSSSSSFSSSTCEKPPEMPKSLYRDDSDVGRTRRKKAPWKSFSLSEYKVYKTELTAEPAAKAEVDASTQTDDMRSRRRPVVAFQEEDDNDSSPAEVPTAKPEDSNPTIELERDEISPPPSSSSTETLESLLIKADGRVIVPCSGPGSGATLEDDGRTESGGYGGYARGRMRASAVLMHLISCGSINAKGHRSARSRLKERMVPRVRSELSEKKMDGLAEGNVAFPAIKPEEKEYFSGSLIETKKESEDSEGGRFAGLRRSSSYNADSRSYQLDVVAENVDAGRDKCIPRKPRPAIRRESSLPVSHSNLGRQPVNDESQREA